MVLPRVLLPLDALTELSRARAEEGNKSEELECLSLLEREGSVDKVYKSVLSSLLAVDANVVVSQMKKAAALKKRKREDRSVGKRDGRGKVRISEKNKVGKGTRVVRRRNKVKKEKQCEKSGPGNKRVKIEKEAVGVGNSRLHHKNTEETDALMDHQSENVARAQSDEMCREQIGGIFQGVVKEEDEAGVEPVVKKELGEEVVRGDYGLASKAVKMEPDHFVDIRSPIEGTYRKTRNVKCPKCSTTFENRGENHVEGRGRSSTVPEPEVVILDSDMIVKKEIPSPFISARMLHRSMADEEAQELALERDSAEFRKELLEVLRKPYDKEEHRKSRKAIQDGSYHIHHPDMHKKLKKYRYKREKCLIVLRGFLFWLQNLTREGAFKPWKDEQCLKVKLNP